MSTQMLSVKLPDDLMRRLRAAVPAHKRQDFLVRAIETAVAAREGGAGPGVRGAPIDFEKLLATYHPANPDPES